MIKTVSEICESMTFTLSLAFSVTLLNLVIFLYYSEEVKNFNKRNAKQKNFLQVFNLSLSPIFDQNNSTIPSVAIVAPYRSLFLRLGSTISFDFRDRPLQLWNFLNFFHSFLMSKRKHGKILSPKLMYN